MIDQLKIHAENAAAAHRVAARVTLFDEVIDENYTGRIVCSVEFHQAVFTCPENKKHLVSEGENRRIISISQTDARRLFKARKGAPGGQEYVISRTASKLISHAADTKENAAKEVLNVLLSGAGRAYAHDVADNAAKIEVEMRDQLRDDLDLLA